MNALATSIRNQPDAFTANGAETFSTSKDAIVDLFFLLGGASQDTPLSIIIQKFEETYACDKERAIRILLHLRDIRGGAGRRQLFRDLMLHLERTHQEVAKEIIPYISEFGRFDDLHIFQTRPLKEAAYATIAKALLDPKTAGLCAKWQKRQGPIAIELRNFLKLTPKQYRKLLVNLTNVVESQMCHKEWDQIEYSHVPSLASIRYAKAFNRHEPLRYQAWRDSLASGKTKVNTGAVYPHDVVRSLINGDSSLATEMWNSLPNYTDDTSIMPIVDVSGSMCTEVQGKVQAIDVSISLGMYLAQKNSGPFKNLFVTFTSEPSFVELTGRTLSENLQKTRTAPWGMSTNLQKAFSLLLKKAISSGASQEDMPKMLLCISDMEFNACTEKGTNFQNIEKQYREAGYELPKIVFWNVAGGVNNVPVRFDQSGVALVSGFSPSVIKSVLAAKEFTPLSIVDETIMNERYALPFYSNLV